MCKIGFLFDLDGVLIDSEKEYTRIWTEIDRKFPSGKENFAYIIKGQTLNKILQENYSDEKIRLGVSEELHRLEKEMKYSFCPGAEQFLDELRQRSCKCAVVTSSDEIKMRHLHADMPHFRSKIDVFVDASKVKKSKPDPEGYLLGARELGADIKKCVVFEDSVQGVKAGNASGAFVIGITGTRKREELMPFSDIVVDGFGELDLNQIIEILTNR